MKKKPLKQVAIATAYGRTELVKETNKELKILHNEGKTVLDIKYTIAGDGKEYEWGQRWLFSAMIICEVSDEKET